MNRFVFVLVYANRVDTYSESINIEICKTIKLYTQKKLVIDYSLSLFCVQLS